MDSLLLPVAAVYVLPDRPLETSLLSIVVGAVIGGVSLGSAAAPGAREGVPAVIGSPALVRTRSRKGMR